MAYHATQKRIEQSTLPLDEVGIALPSAKQSRRASSTPRPWGKFLAAFSQDFAESAIKMLCQNKSDVLYDPFVGSGTTVVAAAKLGVKAIGNDLDPVSALMSRTRVASNFDMREVRALLKPTKKKADFRFAPETSDYFGREDLFYAASVFERIRRSIPTADDSPLFALLEDDSGRFDSEAIALNAVISAASSAAKIVRGSNPVWHRKAVVGERVKTLPLSETAFVRAGMMARDLDYQQIPTKRRIRITCNNASTAVMAPNSVDTVLTSPPYLNRLDYVVNHLSQLLLLTGLHPVSIEDLRRSMTGTTKIVDKSEADERIGATGLSLLQRIKKHQSYASQRYYYYIYAQYFNDMLSVFEQLRKQCKYGAHGIMVVQTSYYKDILVDSTKVFPEMASKIGFHIQPITSEEVIVHYGNLSPRQLKYVPQKKLQEWLLYLQF